MTSSLSRRAFIKLSVALGASASTIGTARAALASSAPCELTPEQEVGPYWLDRNLVRSDIREGKAGVPLTLDIVLTNARTCAPLVGAAVDIWNCDALGVYSGFAQLADMLPPPDFDPKAPGFPPPDGPPGMAGMAGPPPAPLPTDRLTFLRGIQRTDHSGIVRFQTIVPGNYPGRTNHIHFKVRTANASNSRDSHVSHVGQLFFPESLIVQLMKLEPYREHQIRRTALNEDSVFVDQSGSVMLASVSPVSVGDVARGLHARVEAVADPAAEPKAVEPMQGMPAR